MMAAGVCREVRQMLVELYTVHLAEMVLVGGGPILQE